MSSNPSAVLAVMADHLERYHEQVGDLLPHYLADTSTAGSPSNSDADMVNALVESERALRNAARALRKAAKLAGRA